MVGGFILAWLTSESETFRLLHVISGATVLAVAIFRLPWGFIGSRYARFVDFVRGPRAVKDYAASLLRLEPAHHVGHNPAGGWAIVLLLGLGILTGLSGWANYNDIGGEFIEELHEGLAVTMLTVVFIHVAGVLSGSLMHGENLVRAMLNGRKQGMPDEAIRSARPLAGALLLAWVAVAGWWIAT
jgi:cytochrome b